MIAFASLALVFSSSFLHSLDSLSRSMCFCAFALPILSPILLGASEEPCGASLPVGMTPHLHILSYLPCLSYRIPSEEENMALNIQAIKLSTHK